MKDFFNGVRRHIGKMDAATRFLTASILDMESDMESAVTSTLISKRSIVSVEDSSIM